MSSTRFRMARKNKRHRGRMGGVGEGPQSHLRRQRERNHRRSAKSLSISLVHTFVNGSSIQITDSRTLLTQWSAEPGGGTGGHGAQRAGLLISMWIEFSFKF
jgi:hypothetical protein